MYPCWSVFEVIFNTHSNGTSSPPDSTSSVEFLLHHRCKHYSQTNRNPQPYIPSSSILYETEKKWNYWLVFSLDSIRFQRNRLSHKLICKSQLQYSIRNYENVINSPVTMLLITFSNNYYNNVVNWIKYPFHRNNSTNHIAVDSIY